MRTQRHNSAAVYAALALAGLLGCTAAAAQDPPVEPAAQRGEQTTVAMDIKAYVTAPLHAHRPQWVRFAAVLGAVAAAHQYDDETREHFDTQTFPAGESPDTHDGRDAMPAALALGATWVTAALLDDDAGRRETGSMVEAAALSTAASYLLKQAAGRERPYETAESGSWSNGGDSFPSLHTSAAFAIGTVLAESGDDRHRLLRRILGYGLAGATAYARMDHDAHWLSDTVAGAGLGVATARFVMKRRDGSERRAQLGFAPSADGVALTYTVALRP